MHAMTVSFVAVTRAVFAIQHRARRIERRPQRTPLNAISERRAIAGNLGRRVEFRQFTVEFVGYNVVSVEGQHPFRLDLLETEIALPGERVKLALDQAHLRILLTNHHRFIAAETIHHDNLSGPTQLFQRAPDVRCFVEGENHRSYTLHQSPSWYLATSNRRRGTKRSRSRMEFRSTAK